MALLEQHGRWISRKRRWLTQSSAIAIAALIINGSMTAYFAVQSQNLNNQNLNLQKSLYDLQNSLYNFPPFIFSNYTASTLNSIYCNRSDTRAILEGPVTVDLKVISPYNGMLTIKVETFNFTSIYNYDIREYIDPNYINTPQPVQDLTTMPHQYWISESGINSISDKLPIELMVVLKPNCFPLNLTSITLDLGYLTFEASLFAARLNQTIETKNCTANVFGTFTPTS
jgi:hypothetical protein